jgi:hypothetical protein
MGWGRALFIVAFCAAAAAISLAPAAAGPNEDSQTCAKASGEVALAACTRAIDDPT